MFGYEMDGWRGPWWGKNLEQNAPFLHVEQSTLLAAQTHALRGSFLNGKCYII
jgi:hypothetical protein